MKLSVREAARLLSVTENQVYRWVDDGAIPFHRIRHQPMFSRTELLEWATARRLPLSLELFEGNGNGAAAPSLAQALEHGGIHYDLGGDTREAVLAAALERLPGIAARDRAALLPLLVARESLGSTGLGDGIAIPHVRGPVILPGSTGTVTLCFLEKPLDFKAVDGRPVHALFLLVTSTIAAHLQLLSRLSLALLDPRFKSAVIRRDKAQEILAEARRVEAAFARPVPPELAPGGR
jgi:PTS system nitrogen regulatory IIA component